ncbi:MAG: extracellular solute-binding protein [Treponema sp.]|nr:extracellular solute-binding protein [Treponema sp.]
MKERNSVLKRIIVFSFLIVFAAAAVYASGGAQSQAAAVTELKCLTGYKASDMNDPKANPVGQWLDSVTGVKVTYDYLPADSPLDKLNAIMASGASDYDFISMAGGWKDRYAEYAIQGALLDIGAIFKNYPNMQAIPKGLTDQLMVGNTFYGLGSLSPSGPDGYANADGFMLWRTDILNMMGRKMPTTLDDFTNLLQTYKDQDPMKNGATNVPLTITGDDIGNLRGSSIGGAFGVELDWKDQGGTLVPYQTQQGFFEFLQYLNDLYNRGLIDREMPTNNSAAINQKFSTNKALARVDYWWDIPSQVATFKTAYPSATFEFSQPLERNGMAGAQAAAKNPLDIITVIPKGAKNWQATMAYLDKKMDPAIFKEMVIGKEGETYTVDSSGQLNPILPTFFDLRGNANWYLTGTPPEYNTYWWQARARKDLNQLAAYIQVNYTYGNFIHVNPASPAPATVFLQIATASSLSSNMTRDFMINSVVSGVTKAQFDSFVSDWKAQCGDALSKAYNDWYKSL